MSVVTVSGGLFSGSRMVAQELCQRLGYRFIDRKTILERAASEGFAYSELLRVMNEPPGCMKSFEKERRVLLRLLQAALAEEAQEDDVVYHGFTSHLLLKDAPDVLRVGIVAPLEMRIALAQDRVRFSRAQALAHILKADKQRHALACALYGIRWDEPSAYDLMLNMEVISPQAAVDLLASVAKQDRFRFPVDLSQSIADMALAGRVQTELAMHSPRWRRELDIVARRGTVWIGGRLQSEASVERIKVIAQKVPGVKKVELLPVAPDQALAS